MPPFHWPNRHVLCILISRKWLRSFLQARSDLVTMQMISFWYYISHQALHQSAMPGMIPYKRVAVEHSKSGLPMYQPNPAASLAYQQLAAMQQLQQQQQQYIPVTLPMVVTPAPEAAATAALVAAPAGLIPTNAHSVNYFDANQQLLDTLPACRDFKLGLCNRPNCKYVHVLEDYVEVMDGRVTVCRDSVRGKCSRPMCKYYHIPIPLPNSK
ncbi:hypothetical protein KUTeg_012521 [Tegillarca granosa]|uniref:C3H1-type domain-containing protein n=1 Tax=Tegillarca granosa TaxID=220873 RepID=A0ABQ9EZS8_TEGGR|nr:hypothetical protein KUTeg_012521 [Tegillarca granosa]